MHAGGLHSALAIKRQRKRRDEQRRAKERRYSLQSSESGLTSPRGSQGSLDRAGSRRRPRKNRPPPNAMLDSKVVSSVGMLHIGVVFLVLGVFLVGSGLLPDNITSWSALGTTGWWNELVCTGLFAVAVGVFLIILNKYISKNEERDLEEYVQSQLTRSRSGHRLERDVETGGMISKHQKREKRQQKEDEARRLSGITIESPPLTPHSPSSVTVTAATHHGFINPAALNGDTIQDHHLDQIVEEDYSTSEKGRPV
ncbi:uncharacterized protein LOC143910627 isoform X2 [Arctopsyche grandis]|uniref:uncharacterized protein LOC143910627 isoform X2 n=1 Tax=Arctopsyche grandis TaxID=121162 RepID=UPI00406D7331